MNNNKKIVDEGMIESVRQQYWQGCIESEDRRPKTKPLENEDPPRKRRPRKRRPP